MAELTDYERAQIRFKQLSDEGATFRCPICEGEIPVAEIHTHFVLSGYMGCENKKLDDSSPTHEKGLSPETYVRQALRDSVERQVVQRVLLDKGD